MTCTAAAAPALERSPMERTAATAWLRFDNAPVIENRWNYAAEAIERLRARLAAGVRAKPDPVRQSLYEVEDAGSVYYIHVSPVNCHVMLLAVWSAD